MARQNRGSLPALSHDLAEFGQLGGGGGSSIPVRGQIIPSIGDYYTLKAAGTSLTPATDGTLRLYPISLPPATYDQVAIQVSTAGSAGALAKVVGYWGNSWQSGDPPVNLAFETAWVDVSTSGQKNVTIPTPIVVGTSAKPLYFGVALSGTLTTVPQFSSFDTNGLWGNEAATNTILWFAEISTGFQASGFTSPAPASLSGTSRINSGSALWGWFRRSA